MGQNRPLARLGRGRTHAEETIIGLGRNRRGEAFEPLARSGEQRFRIVGKIAGEHGGLGRAIEGLGSRRFAGNRHADDRGQPFAPAHHDRLAGRPHRSERDGVDRGAGEPGAPGRALGHASEDAFQPVVVEMMQLVGLGRGEQDAIDARAEQVAQPRAPSAAEAVEDRGQRAFEVVQRGRSRVERRRLQRDLAAEYHSRSSRTTGTTRAGWTARSARTSRGVGRSVDILPDR